MAVDVVAVIFVVAKVVFFVLTVIFDDLGDFDHVVVTVIDAFLVNVVPHC